MKKIISAITHKLNYLFKDIKLTQFLSITLVGCLILTTTVNPLLSKETATNKIDKMLLLNVKWLDVSRQVNVG